MARFEIPRSSLIEQADDNGVLHRDVGREHVLINPETKGVMVIDFERADLLDKTTSQRRRDKTRRAKWRHPKRPHNSCAVEGRMMLSLLYKNDCSLKCTSGGCQVNG
ncbi:hypothetical protein E4U19_007113 [Claviceps sp. Clav32 group G5]|nr:hypothetical protein E4U19_007113 [Claviceps sp. Clav32 group G5]